MNILAEIFSVLLGTITDVLPIAAIIFGFQFLIIRKPVPNLKKVLVGICYVLIGITFFLIGLDMALFKLGDTMAKQLTDPEFIGGIGTIAESLEWSDYYWVYLFAADHLPTSYVSRLAPGSLRILDAHNVEHVLLERLIELKVANGEEVPAAEVDAAAARVTLPAGVAVELDGEIVETLVEDGHPVELDQPLFRVRA